MKKIATTLEEFIKKYGETTGDEKWEKWKNRFKGRYTIQWFIEKYGELEGKNKYEEKNKKSSVSLKIFIERYGKEEGTKKYNEFRKKCAIKNEIKNDPTSKYNNREFATTLDYWIKKCNGNVEEAKLKLQERQNTSSLKKFISKYGKEEGTKKYIECNKNKALTIKNFIRLYGEEEGKYQYKKWKDNLQGRYSLKWFIQRYGEIEGNLKREEWLNTFKGKDSLSINWFIRKYGEEHGTTNYKNFWKARLEKIKNVSIISDVLFDRLFEKLKENDIIFNKIYYGDTEYLFYINNKEFSIIKPDLYIKDINLVIEFYGDYWHRNPAKYITSLENEYIWNKDAKRIETLKNKYGCKILIIWEKDFKENREIVIDEIINKIKQIL
jgi:G:T-mismatch repair DNA endonuclease (very short patch repair protein)